MIRATFVIKSNGVIGKGCVVCGCRAAGARRYKQARATAAHFWNWYAIGGDHVSSKCDLHLGVCVALVGMTLGVVLGTFLEFWN